jgi:hypothetical protein
MKTPSLATLLAAALALHTASGSGQATRPGARTAVPVVRQGADSVAVLLRRAHLRNRSGGGAVQSSLTTREKTVAMAAAGRPTAVFSTPFRLSPGAPVVAGRGSLTTWRATSFPYGPNAVAESPAVAVYDRAGGTGDSFVSLMLNTVRGTRYLIDCQLFKGSVFVVHSGSASAFVGSAPVTFVLEATETGTAFVSLEGEGSRDTGYWVFYGCDITPST